MGIREQFQKVIDRKHQEIKDLELSLEKAKAYVQAIQDSMRFLPKDYIQGDAGQSLRPGTDLAKTRDVLKAAGKPMRINDILEAIGKANEKNNRISLSGSLSSYVRKGQIFSRPAPNTFGLIEMTNNSNGSSGAEIELPEDFGEMAMTEDK